MTIWRKLEKRFSLEVGDSRYVSYFSKLRLVLTKDQIEERRVAYDFENFTSHRK